MNNTSLTRHEKNLQYKFSSVSEFEIKTLAEIKIEKIERCFREIFLNAHEDSFSRTLRWETAGVDFSKSLGALMGEKLVGFFLISEYDAENFLFSAGIHPDYRHRGIFRSLMEKVTLRPSTHLHLEVLSTDGETISLYEHFGFTKTRKLLSFEGIFRSDGREMKDATYSLFPYSGETISNSLYTPSWEGKKEVLMKSRSWHEVHEIKLGKETVASAVFTPALLQFRQIGATEERFLDQLFIRMKLDWEFLRIFGIEEGSKLENFLLNRGLKQTASQWEMATSGS